MDLEWKSTSTTTIWTEIFDEDQAPNNGSSSHSTTSTPQSASRSQSTPKYHSSNSSSSNGSPVKTRSLQEIYEVTHGNDDDG